MVNAIACTIELWMHAGGCWARKKRKSRLWLVIYKFLSSQILVFYQHSAWFISLYNPPINPPINLRDFIGYFTSRGGQLSRNNPRLSWYLSSSSDFHRNWKPRSAEKRSAREFQFSSLLFYMEEKQPSFVESSDSDIRKLDSNAFSEITKSTKYEPQKA